MQYIVIQIVAVIALKTSLTKQFDKRNNRLITFFCQCFFVKDLSILLSVWFHSEIPNYHNKNTRPNPCILKNV